MKRCLIFLSIILISTASFLFSPRTIDKGPNSLCPHQYIRLNSLMGFPINCDAFTFMGAAVDPSYLMQPAFARQSRPLYIITGTLTTYSFYYLSYPIHGKINQLVATRFSGEFSTQEQKNASLFVSAYAGFVFINLVSLILSLFFFNRIVEMISGPWKNGGILWFFILMMLASNHVTKIFFWSPHQQMFNILAPLVCLYVSLKIFLRQPSFEWLLMASVLSGFAVLIYGNFLLLWPVILLCYLINSKQESILRRVRTAAYISALCLLPMLAWIIILNVTGIGFYSDEIGRFREFVWPADAIGDPNKSFLHEIFSRLISFLETFGSTLLMLGLLISVALSIKFSKKQPFVRSPLPASTWSIFTFVILLFFLFLWLLGYYSDRLTFSFSPLVLSITAILLNRQRIPKTAQSFLAVVLIAIHIYNVLFSAPHFSDRFYY